MRLFHTTRLTSTAPAGRGKSWEVILPWCSHPRNWCSRSLSPWTVQGKLQRMDVLPTPPVGSPFPSSPSCSSPSPLLFPHLRPSFAIPGVLAYSCAAADQCVPEVLLSPAGSSKVTMPEKARSCVCPAAVPHQVSTFPWILVDTVTLDLPAPELE